MEVPSRERPAQTSVVGALRLSLAAPLVPELAPVLPVVREGLIPRRRAREEQRIVGRGVDLAFGDPSGIGQGIARRAMYSRRAAERIGVLHLVRGLDQAAPLGPLLRPPVFARQQSAYVGGAHDLPPVAPRLM